MNITLERSDLTAAMGRVASIVDKKSTIPILANVHLLARDDTLMIRATNGDMEAFEAIRATVIEPGEITTPADMLAEWTRSLPAGAQLNLKIEKTKLAATSGRAKINLPTIRADDFPRIWADEGATKITVGASVLAGMLARVAFAQEPAGTPSTYVQGVRFEGIDGALRLIALNFKIIAVVDGPPCEDFEGVTVPTKMVTQMASLTSGLAGDVTLSISPGKISMAAGGSVITSKLIDKSLGYPAYERARKPGLDAPHRAIIDVDAIKGAILRTRIAQGDNKDKLMKLSFSPGGLAITARHEYADAFDMIDAEYDGPEVVIGLNSTFLMGILDAATGDTVEARLKDSGTAMFFSAPGDDTGGAVIAPVRI